MEIQFLARRRLLELMAFGVLILPVTALVGCEGDGRPGREGFVPRRELEEEENEEGEDGEDEEGRTAKP